jgi:membrane-bound lytic murein transglycosylase B
VIRAIVCALSVLSAASLSAAQEPTRPSFADFLAGVRTDALARGIREEIVNAALADIAEPLPVVIERDRSQAETVFSLEKYIARILTARMIGDGRAKLAAHKPLLNEIGEVYGVDPKIIVAIWGMETHYGGFTGTRPIVAALATLAWDARRPTLFRGELFNALEILNRDEIELQRLKGSWAGAMGQVQFMPSSYLEFAEDYDGDGRRDIWSTPADIFASIANYLLGHGWTAGQPWGREVRVLAAAARTITNQIARRTGGCQATRDMTIALPARRWNALGVRTAAGGALPSTLPETFLVSGTTRHFLVTRNYDALLDYNCSRSYALSVGLLADRLGTRPSAKSNTPPRRTRKEINRRDR